MSYFPPFALDAHTLTGYACNLIATTHRDNPQALRVLPWIPFLVTGLDRVKLDWWMHQREGARQLYFTVAPRSTMKARFQHRINGGELAGIRFEHWEGPIAGKGCAIVSIEQAMNFQAFPGAWLGLERVMRDRGETSGLAGHPLF